MQPNTAGFRPREGLGKEAEALEEMRPVTAIEKQPGSEIQDDERKCDELDEPV
jgi:hypothetical protein